MNGIDPSGLDALVALYPGAATYGHIGIGINSKSTTGFYPAKGSSMWDLIAGNPVPGTMLPDTRIPIATFTIHNTSAQDQAIQNYINARIKNPGIYDTNNRNCTTTVRDALNAGGIKLSPTIYPRELMFNIMQQYGGQQ